MQSYSGISMFSQRKTRLENGRIERKCALSESLSICLSSVFKCFCTTRRDITRLRTNQWHPSPIFPHKDHPNRSFADQITPSCTRGWKETHNAPRATASRSIPPVVMVTQAHHKSLFFQHCSLTGGIPFLCHITFSMLDHLRHGVLLQHFHKTFVVTESSIDTLRPRTISVFIYHTLRF